LKYNNFGNENLFNNDRVELLGSGSEKNNTLTEKRSAWDVVT